MTNDWIHRILDDEDRPDDRPAAGSREHRELTEYREALRGLSRVREEAPSGFTRQVMQALPDRPDPTWRNLLRGWWPTGGRWFVPALAGALASLFLALGVGRMTAPRGAETVRVQFELHAPAAHRVELVGTFNDWKPGEIVLQGPDATGHWTGTVELPAGRHEYLFLVDGSDWRTDPRATAHRPDGFGRRNALIDL